jgi:hypothetical protein
MLYHASCLLSNSQREWERRLGALLFKCSVVVVRVTLPWLRCLPRDLIHLYVYACRNTEYEVATLPIFSLQPT